MHYEWKKSKYVYLKNESKHVVYILCEKHSAHTQQWISPKRYIEIKDTCLVKAQALCLFLRVFDFVHDPNFLYKTYHNGSQPHCLGL